MRGISTTRSAALLARNFSLAAVCVIGFAQTSHACDLVIPVSELMTATEVAPTSVVSAATHVTVKSITLKAYRLTADQNPILVGLEKVTPAAAQEKTGEHAVVLEAAKKTGCVAICQTVAEGLGFKAVDRKSNGSCQ